LDGYYSCTIHSHKIPLNVHGFTGLRTQEKHLIGHQLPYPLRLEGWPDHSSTGPRRFISYTGEGTCLIIEWRTNGEEITSCYENNIAKLTACVNLVFPKLQVYVTDLCYGHFSINYTKSMCRKCIADTTSIRLCISNSEVVESTVYIWYCCSTENVVWRICCSYRFGTVTILHEVELYHNFQNKLTYIKEMHTSLQSPNKDWANRTHDPSAVQIWVLN